MSSTSVTGRAMAVLGSFTRDHPTQTLSQIAARTGLALSTTHRLVAELTAWGALERGPQGWSVGLRLVEIAALSPRGPGLREQALPHLEDLYEATHQNVQLGVRDGVDLVYIELIRARTAVTVRTRVGARWPLHATGMGLVMLAYAPSEVQEQVLTAPLRAYTTKTLSRPSQVRQAMAEVHRTGYVVSDGQITLDGYSVAAPIIGPTGEVVAAVSVVVPADDRRRAAWGPAVRTAARGISRELGVPAATGPARGGRTGRASSRSS